MSNSNSLTVLTPMLNGIGERRLFEFLDFVDTTTAARFRAWLTTPVMFRWLELAEARRWVVTLTFCTGLAATFCLVRQPRWLPRDWRSQVGLYDAVLIAAAWFFARQAVRSAVRWGGWEMSAHRMIVVAVLGGLSLFAALCLRQRTTLWGAEGWQKVAFAAFLLALLGFLQGTWILFAGTSSPEAVTPVPREYALGSFLFGLSCLVAGWLTSRLGKRKANKRAAPNDGPAAALENLRVTGRPPSPK